MKNYICIPRVASIFSLALILASSGYSQVTINQDAYGIVVSSTEKHLKYLNGSGFVIAPNIIITCYHVFRDAKIKPTLFMNIKGDSFRITLVDSLPNQDIAVYRTKKYITKKPMQLIGAKGLKIGDTIAYLGYDAIKRGNYIDLVPVTHIDTIIIRNSPVIRISFKGNAIPGYSGGPIWSYRNHKVIGLIAQAVTIRDRSTGKTYENDVGYSVDPLLQLRHFK